MSVTLHFRGVSPSPTRLLVTGGERVSDMVTVGNTLASSVVEIMPTAKVTCHQHLMISDQSSVSFVDLDLDLDLDVQTVYCLTHLLLDALKRALLVVLTPNTPQYPQSYLTHYYRLLFLFTIFILLTA